MIGSTVPSALSVCAKTRQTHSRSGGDQLRVIDLPRVDELHQRIYAASDAGESCRPSLALPTCPASGSLTCLRSGRLGWPPAPIGDRSKGAAMFTYRVYDADGNELGEATYTQLIQAGGERVRAVQVVDVVELSDAVSGSPGFSKLQGGGIESAAWTTTRAPASRV